MTTLVHQIEEFLSTHPNPGNIRFLKKSIPKKNIDILSNQLAHFLISKGVKKGAHVIVSLERSFESIVSFLAILKLGAVYIPVDPEFPIKRQQYILKDTNALIILTQKKFIRKFKMFSGNVVCVDEKLFITEIQKPIKQFIQPEDTAYIFYTSGSTGHPKGIKVPHRGLLNRLNWMRDYYLLRSEDIILHKTSASFDVSLWEISLPFITPSQLVLAPQSTSQDMYALYKIIHEEGITTIHFVPSILKCFLDIINLKNKENLSSLKHIISSGENLSLTLQNYCFEKIDANLYNLYGPTEASIDVTYWRCQRDSFYKFVPIGCSIPHCSIYILDAQHSIVSDGEEGEIAISGVGLGTEYINQPSLTKAVFPTIVINDNLTRLYLTGDRGIKHEGGVIQYLGREDSQVKIRGFRVELEEIEAILLKYVEKSTVLSVGEDHKILVAFISGTTSIQELRSFLSKELPSYMIPHKFIHCEKFPYLLNGKLDRKKLIQLYESSQVKSQEKELVEPTMWGKILSILCDLLNVRNIKLEDNFFSLGGDSIIAIQLVSRARNKGILLKVSDITKYPTFEQLVKVAKKKEGNSVKRMDLSGKFPLTPIQQWFSTHRSKGFWNQSILINSMYPIEIESIKKSLEFLVSYHEGLCLYYDSIEGLQSYGPPNFEVHIGSTVNLSAFHAAIDENKGPLLQVVIDKSFTNMAIIASHFIIDGVSWRVLIEDLDTVYSQIKNKTPPTLPQRTDSYKKWERKLRVYSQDRSLLDEEPYWVATLIGIKPFFLKEKTSSVAEKKRNIFWGSISVWETRHLLFKVLSFYKAQINDILLTSFLEVLSTMTDQKNICINLEGHGRENIISNIDVSRSIGWFTSLYPVKFFIQNPKDSINNLKHVRKTLQSIPNKGIGYGILKYISNVKTLSKMQEPDVVFNYLGQWNHQGALFKLQGKPGVDNIESTQKLPHALEVTGLIIHDQLHFSILSNEFLDNLKAKLLLKMFLENLKSFIYDKK